MLAKHRQAEGMERHHRHAMGRTGQKTLQPLRHLLRGAPAEGEGQALLGRSPAVGHEVGKAVREGAGLAGAWSGHDQHRPGHRLGRRPLLGIELVQDWIGGQC